MINQSELVMDKSNHLVIHGWEHTEESNHYSLINYINQLFERRSRLLVVRVDLGYRIGTSGQYMAEDIRECFSRFRNNSRRNRIFTNELGYVWALEWSPFRGFHYHCLFLFDGHKSQQDITIGHQIGRYWNDVITRGNGYYHCSNDDKERLRHNNCPVGIGMIDRTNAMNRENLFFAATYLLKQNNSINAVLPEGHKRFRTFGHGVCD